MTRPPQPQEYGATQRAPAPRDYGKAQTSRTYQKAYRNQITGQPYTGDVWVFQDGVRLATVALEDGVFKANLPAGNYHLTAELFVDGRTRYLDEDVVV